MRNPWEKISLADYENHMKLESVKQLQSLNRTVKSQLFDYEVNTVMILGVAGGNGLEHIDTKKYINLDLDITRLLINVGIIALQIVVMMLNLSLQVEMLINGLLFVGLLVFNGKIIQTIFGFIIRLIKR